MINIDDTEKYLTSLGYLLTVYKVYLYIMNCISIKCFICY